MSIARTASLNVRIEPQAKASAERVFEAVGLSTADAINIFLKQVAYRQAIPFSLEIPAGPANLDIDRMSDAEFRAEIKKGIISADTEKLLSEKDVFEGILE